MLKWEPGDLLILYSDGINGADAESGERPGLKGLLSLAQKLATYSAAVAGRALGAAVSRFRGTRPADDDQTMLVLQMQERPA